MGTHNSFSKGVVWGFLMVFVFENNFCYGDDKNVFEVVGTGECADCANSNIKTSQAFSGLRVTIDCKPPQGGFKTRAVGQLDKEGKFKATLPAIIFENGKLKEECYAQLHSSSATPCPVYSGLDSSKIIIIKFDDANNKKQTLITTAGNLKFSLATCTSAFLWPFFGYPPLPPKAFSKFFPGHPFPLPHKVLPPIFKKPCPPIYKTPLPPLVPVYEKPLPPPVPIYKTPVPPPVPIYKPKQPVFNPPPFKKPLPPPVPIYKPKPPIFKPHPYTKPLPPPVPIYKPKPKPPIFNPPTIPKVLPPPVPIYKKPLPPLVPVYEKPLPPPLPTYPFIKPLPPLFPKIVKKPLPPFPTIPPKYFHHPKHGSLFPFPPFSLHP